MNKYPYLKDSNFLFDFFRQKNLEQTVKITVLNFAEKPLKEIQGKVLNGNINIDGNSSVRRTANLSIFIDEFDASYMEVGGLFSLNKKVKIEIGLTNTTESYIDYSTIWFPMGTYVIMEISISRGTNGTDVSLQLKDKMVFLNGECGGTIPATVCLSEYDEIDPTTGDWVIKKPTMIQIIQELVNHFGGEQLGKIIISDLDTRVKKVMKWTKDTPLYVYIKNKNSDAITNASYLYSLNSKAPSGYVQAREPYQYGEDIGFIYVDFYYPGEELVADAGSSVCDMLDKIKNTLGNFEYFYDLDGNFIFQEVKNYLNNTPKITNVTTDVNQDDYIIQPKKGKALYSFDSCNDMITSYSNSPQYSQIKNDFIVWGVRKGVNDESFPIRYHLAIDDKPTIGNKYKVCLIKDNTITTEDIYYAKLPIEYNNKSNFPTVGEVERLYLDKEKQIIYQWNPDKGKYEEYGKTSKVMHTVQTQDWRTELYLSGAMTTRFGNDSNFYYSELANEWSKLFTFVKQGDVYIDIMKSNIDTSVMDYFLDLIDSTAAIAEFNISNIGRRTKVVNDDSINCLFEKPILDIIVIEKGRKDTEDLQAEAEDKKQNYTLVDAAIYEGLSSGGTQNSAYNLVRDLLYEYTSYNEIVSVQMLPLYFLEPNIRIQLKDEKSGIHGDFMINSIAMNLDINGQMSLSCTKALDRI